MSGYIYLHLYIYTSVSIYLCIYIYVSIRRQAQFPAEREERRPPSSQRKKASRTLTGRAHAIHACAGVCECARVCGHENIGRRHGPMTCASSCPLSKSCRSRSSALRDSSGITCGKPHDGGASAVAIASNQRVSDAAK